MDIETPPVYDSHNNSLDESNINQSSSSPMSPRRRLAIIALIFLAAVGLIVGLTVGLTRPNTPIANGGSGGSNTVDEEEPVDTPGGENDGSADVPGTDEDVSSPTEPIGAPDDQTISQLTFQPNLRSFSSDILSGYNDCSVLVQDIEETAKYLVNVLIANNVRYGDEEVVALDGEAPMDAAPSASQGKSSYGTNNQVENVDEADIVKSDGTNVFLAYGNDLVWMLTNGTIVQRLTMPTRKDSFPSISHWDVISSSSGSSGGGGSPEISLSSVGMGDFWGPPPQRIAGLLLDESNGELNVIISYYSYFEFKFVSGHMTATHTYSYDDGSVGLTLKKEMVHKGQYQTARFVSSQTHVVTRTDIDTYKLRDAMGRYNYPGMTDDQYRDAAYSRAVLLLPKYSKQLLAELISDANGVVQKDMCSRIIGISDMTDGAASRDIDDDPTYGSGLMNGFARTVSFSSSSGADEAVVSGAFLPSYGLELYANADYLVLAGQGWMRDPTSWSYLDYTYLMQFKIGDNIGDGASPFAIGSVKGRFLNQFSIDEYNNYLRVATTSNAKWEYDDKKATWVETSPSSSQIYMLQKDESSSILKEAAVLSDIGVTEDIYSVRFFRDQAYVVTFRRIDPFYTIDLSNPLAPKVAGELKIPGYSNYLHPIDNNQYVLAVGQSVNETTGRNQGLQISLFDVTDFASPRRIQNTVIEGWSWSDAQSDHLSFRYFDNTLILPVEVMYSNSMSLQNQYDGFYVYDVSVEEGITAQGKVTHATQSYMRDWCWSNEYIPSRSMVFEGRLMTMKGHVVIMSDGLVQPNEEW
eukprot:CAMPEP_0172480130 /NCGR_PEP_ID=MMETSP1066-20121228/5091_1 /TAXON_ID=671091 /ORGANISM="Coscinodiscus wailesii, Strain CCMP2513" /LENGTH=806 /DNA_ID=CAMNT_0013241181 /DNA_START=260 /DNA_END=2677 /DNA_ORIENTATION=-